MAAICLSFAVAELTRAKAEQSGDDALIAALKLEILKLRHALYGTRSEGKSRLTDQLEVQLEELEANAGEDEIKAEPAATAAAMHTLIVTAKMNDVDPLVWLADVFARIADIPQNRLLELLPWPWKAVQNIKKPA